MSSTAKKWALNLVKVGIAVVGLWFVIHSTPWNDAARLKAGAEVRGVKFEEAVGVRVLPKEAGLPENVLKVSFGSKKVKMLVPTAGAAGTREVEDVVSEGSAAGIPNTVVLPSDMFVEAEAGKGPAIEVGFKNLIKRANLSLLAAAWAVLIIPFLVTAWRWKKLMEPQGIFLPMKKCLALTFVGQFYSSFLPGTTTGDIVKIAYASKVTGSKTKSAITVLLDRVIGLVALMIIAGTAAATQAGSNPLLKKIAVMIGMVLAGLVVGCVVYFSRRLRRLTGMEYVLEHSKLPRFIKHADETLHVYRDHKRIIAAALGVSLIAQFAVPFSAWLAGMSFGMRSPMGSFFAYVPVAILATSIPVSPPQGLGVTEFILRQFFVVHGVDTASQSAALAQCVRFLPILWNMVGAYWVVTGSYSRHQAEEEVGVGEIEGTEELSN